MKYRLPVLEERGVMDAAATRGELAATFELDVLSKGSVTCHKGCSNCCHNPVMVSILEGISIFRWLSEHHKWSAALRESIEGHHNTVYGLSLNMWLMSDVACPLLDKNECLAYEGRPFACRTTFSKGDSHFCHPHRLLGADRIVPRRDVLDKQAVTEARVLRRFKKKMVLLPLSTALLLAERICKGEFSLQEYMEQVLLIEVLRG